MTETEPEKPPEQPGELWDAPNQQVVRADESPPWEEGTGGEPGEGTPPEPEPPPPPPPGEPGPQAMSAPSGQPSPADLDAMTKAELLAYAQGAGVSPANNDMTKDEIRANVDRHLGR